MNVRVKRITHEKIVEDNFVLFRSTRRVPGDTLALYLKFSMTEYLNGRSVVAAKLLRHRKTLQHMIRIHNHERREQKQ